MSKSESDPKRLPRDTSGQLKGLVEQFSAATDTITRNSLMDQILYKWTESDVERELVLC